MSFTFQSRLFSTLLKTAYLALTLFLFGFESAFATNSCTVPHAGPPTFLVQIQCPYHQFYARSIPERKAAILDLHNQLMNAPGDQINQERILDSITINRNALEGHYDRAQTEDRHNEAKYYHKEQHDIHYNLSRNPTTSVNNHDIHSRTAEWHKLKALRHAFAANNLGLQRQYLANELDDDTFTRISSGNTQHIAQIDRKLMEMTQMRRLGLQMRKA